MKVVLTCSKRSAERRSAGAAGFRLNEDNSLWECSGLTELWNRRGVTFFRSIDKKKAPPKVPKRCRATALPKSQEHHFFSVISSSSVFFSSASFLDLALEFSVSVFLLSADFGRTISPLTFTLNSAGTTVRP